MRRLPHLPMVPSLSSCLADNDSRHFDLAVTVLLLTALGACTPVPIPTADTTGTPTPSVTSTATSQPVNPTPILAATPRLSPTATVLPLPNDSKPSIAATRSLTAPAGLKPTAVQTLVAYDHNPRAILVEVDLDGGLAPAPHEAHVPLFRLYADGFLVFAGEQTPLSTGLDAVVRTGYLSETDIQQLLAFLRDSGFYNLDAYYEPKPVPSDLPTASITVNLGKAKSVQVYAPGFGNTPTAFRDAFAFILASVPETTKSFVPAEGYLVALPAGGVSDFRSKDVLAEWAPTAGVRLADATGGIMVSGGAYTNVVSLVARTWPSSLFREGDRAYRVSFSPQLPRAVHLSDWIGTILQAPREFEGRAFDLVGYYRGSNLLGEASGGPPVSKSDWVIADETGAIYVTGAQPAGLDRQSKADIWNLVHVRGVVVYVRLGTSYLEAQRAEIQAAIPLEATRTPIPSATLTIAANSAASPAATLSMTPAPAPMRLATRASGTH